MAQTRLTRADVAVYTQGGGERFGELGEAQALGGEWLCGGPASPRRRGEVDRGGRASEERRVPRHKSRDRSFRHSEDVDGGGIMRIPRRR